MKILSGLFLSFCILFISPQTFAQSEEPLMDDVIVFKEHTRLPEKVRKIGSVKIGDRMRFNCGYSRTVEIAKSEAREKGGNAIRIINVKPPDVWSTCYRIDADVYVIEPSDLDAVFESQDRFEDSVTKILLPDTANYALLFIYRPAAFYGSAVSYKVHVGDSLSYKLGNNSMHIVKLTKEGPITIWSRIGAIREQKLNAKFGKAYFLRYETQSGIGLQPVSISQGIYEVGAIDKNATNSGGDDVYRK